jgi:hypothetical protein
MSFTQRVVAACKQHVVGRDGRNCRNCHISAAWIAEQNRMRGSTYDVPGSHPRVRRHWSDWTHVYLSGQPLPLLAGTRELVWIEVTW